MRSTDNFMRRENTVITRPRVTEILTHLRQRGMEGHQSLTLTHCLS